MKRTLILAFILGFFALSSCDDCSNTNPANNNNPGYTKSDGLILGPDFRECVCCGGWFVEIKSDTLRIFNMPPDFEYYLMGEDMPVPVRVAWKDKEEDCGEAWDDIIEISSIELR